MPITTVKAATMILQVTFSFKKKLDINDAQTGEEAPNDVAFETPMYFTPKRNIKPPSVIPKIPEVIKKIKFLFFRSIFLVHGLDTIKRSMKRKGKRIVLAKITLIFDIPTVIRINPIDHAIEATKAVRKPR